MNKRKRKLITILMAENDADDRLPVEEAFAEIKADPGLRAIPIVELPSGVKPNDH